jgi:hypothetical protein
MSQFTNRIERDLGHIADRATASPTAWEAIQIRTDQQADQPEAEIIIMDNNPNPPARIATRTLVLGAAAALILIVGGIAALIRYNDEDSTISAAAAPVDVARSFIEAEDAWDAEAALALLAPDVVIHHGLLTQAEEYPSLFAWDKALDWHYTVEECNQIAVTDPVEVVCTFSHDNAWTEALGVGPFSGSSTDFVIADGQIQELTRNFNFSTGFSTQAWDVFESWVKTNHPDGHSLIYRGNDPNLTPEALALWEQYTSEFVASLTQ